MRTLLFASAWLLFIFGLVAGLIVIGTAPDASPISYLHPGNGIEHAAAISLGTQLIAGGILSGLFFGALGSILGRLDAIQASVRVSPLPLEEEHLGITYRVQAFEENGRWKSKYAISKDKQDFTTLADGGSILYTSTPALAVQAARQAAKQRIEKQAETNH